MAFVGINPRESIMACSLVRDAKAFLSGAYAGISRIPAEHFKIVPWISITEINVSIAD